MDSSEKRREPRFPLGVYIAIKVNHAAEWRELKAFTVNASHHGVLVTLNEAPELGERVMVEFPPPAGGWGEAIVRHVIRGTTNYLVGIRLQEPGSGWPGQP